MSPNPAHFYPLHRIDLIKVSALSLAINRSWLSHRTIYILLPAFLVHTSFFIKTLFTQEVFFIPSLLFIHVLLFFSHFIAFLKSFLANDFLHVCKKPCSLTISNDVALYGEQDGSPKVVRSESVSGAGMNDPDEFQRQVRGIDLNYEPSAGLSIIRAVITHRIDFFLPQPYAFNNLSMEQVSETLGGVSIYVFYVCVS